MADVRKREWRVYRGQKSARIWREKRMEDDGAKRGRNGSSGRAQKPGDNEGDEEEGSNPTREAEK